MNSRLAKVHWQAGDRLLPAPAVSVAGESAQCVDPAEIPSDGDIARLGQALADGVHGDRDELMANTAAYSGLRWGELQLTQDTGAQQVSRRSGRHRTASNREGYPGRHGNDGNADPGPHKPPPPLRHEHPAA